MDNIRKCRGKKPNLEQKIMSELVKNKWPVSGKKKHQTVKGGGNHGFHVSICTLLGLRTKILDCTVKTKKGLMYATLKIAMAFQEPFNSNSSVILNTF